MSRFTNPDPIGRYLDNGVDFELHESLGYAVGDEKSEEKIIVPAGFVTDFASIPQCLHNILPPSIGRRAAIIHDYLYSTKGLDGRYTRKQSDAIFLEALKVLGIPFHVRMILFIGVRIGGWVPWSN